MLKKWFTLVEMIVVIIIMALLLSIMLLLWFNYIKRMQLRNDKEQLISTYFWLVSQSMSSNYFYWNKFNQIGLSLNNWGSELNVLSLSGDSFTKNIWFSKLSYSSLSWFQLWWNHYDEWLIILESYEIWCWFKSWIDYFTWWDLRFDLNSNNSKDKYCFEISLNSCKIDEKECD